MFELMQCLRLIKIKICTFSFYCNSIVTLSCYETQWCSFDTEFVFQNSESELFI